MQNHAESSRNYLKNSVLDPKCAKLDQRFYGNLREILRQPYGKFTKVFLPFSNAFLRKITFSTSRQRFLIVLTCSWVFWSKNDIERMWNYLKKRVLDPKHAKFDQQSGFYISGLDFRFRCLVSGVRFLSPEAGNRWPGPGGTLERHRQSQPLSHCIRTL